MKKIVLSFVFMLLYQFSNAQCSVVASGFGNNRVAGYGITGDVTVTLNSNNTVTLDLGSNFSTANGPDVRAYLVNSNGMSTAQLQTTVITDLTRIEFGLVGCTGCNPFIPSSGAKSFTVSVPNGQDIRDYDKVFFYCFDFKQFWDFGNYTPFTDTNCDILSVDDINSTRSLKIVPNPANDVIKLSGNSGESVQIQIFDVLGKIVYDRTKNFNENISVSRLKSGIYLLSARSQKSQTSKKLVIK